MIKTAELSPDGVHRYSLTREWDAERTKMAWVMLNPSTADADMDDPTIRRCMGFARREDYGGIRVVNLISLRCTDPHGLLPRRARGYELCPEENLDAIEHALSIAWAECAHVVAAWGAHVVAEMGARLLDRPYAEWLGQAEQLVCLGKAKSGAPRHPLYVRADQSLERWP